MSEEIPGLAEAIRRESAVRDGAYLDAPEFICGVEVMPFTLRHFATLSAIGSPFICGGPKSAEDVALFLWVVSPDYKRAYALQERLWPVSARLGRWCMGFVRWRTVRRFRRIKLAQAMQSIESYIEDALMDCRKGDPDDSKSYWSMFASVVSVISLKYGWTESDILAIPTKRLWQYLRIANHISDPSRPMFNPSDGFISKWLEKENAHD